MVVVVVIVGLVALGGWLFFGGRQTPDSQVVSHSARDNSGSKKPAPRTNTAGGAAIAPGDQYLAIPEWGIKLKMDDADKVTYVMHGTPNGSPNSEMVTSYASLRLKDGLTASEACKDLGIALTQLTDAPYSVKIGNYYYGYEGAPGACQDSSVESVRTKIVGTEINTGAMSAL